MPKKKKSPPRIATINPRGHSVDCEAIPSPVLEEMSRVILRGVRTFFSDPQVKADYEVWLAEYRKTHPTDSEDECMPAAQGGEA